MTMSVNQAHFSVFIFQHFINATIMAQMHICLCWNCFNKCKA